MRRNRNAITAMAVFIWAACCIGTLWTHFGAEPPREACAPGPALAVTAQSPVHTPAPEPSPGGQITPAPPPEKVQIMQGEFTVTAYCSCEKCCGYWATVRPVDENGEPIVYTASGTEAEEGRTIAADPEVFEYGTEVWLDGPWGVQAFVVEDILGGASGRHIDIYFDNHEAARQWGLQTREVWLEMKE